MPEGSPEGIDLLEAIALAGGYTRIAAPEKLQCGDITRMAIRFSR